MTLIWTWAEFGPCAVNKGGSLHGHLFWRQLGPPEVVHYSDPWLKLGEKRKWLTVWTFIAKKRGVAHNSARGDRRILLHYLGGGLYNPEGELWLG